MCSDLRVANIQLTLQMEWLKLGLNLLSQSQRCAVIPQGSSR